MGRGQCQSKSTTQPVDRPIILVIEDDPDIAHLISRVLGVTRYAFFTAPSGESGLRLAREVAPAVITLDLALPDMRGTEVLRELKNMPETREIPVIIVSIHGDEHFWLDGAFDILSKPIDREKLRSVVVEALASRQD